MREQVGLTPRQTAESAWVVDESGRHFAGAAAINRSLRELGGLWPGIAGLYALPPMRVLEDVGYRWFARNRGRIAPTYRRMQQSRKKRP